MSNFSEQTRRIRIVCISDTHNQTPSLPAGDILIHAGDLTNQGTYSELLRQVTWLEKTNFEVKIVVAGNHDLTLDSGFYEEHWQAFHNQGKQDREACGKLLRDSKTIAYLEHESVSVEVGSEREGRVKVKVFGSPYSPAHGLWAFSYEAEDAEELWKSVTEDMDVVITHTPPFGHCDKARPRDERVGCAALTKRLGRVRPKVHVCGHIHEGRGAERVWWDGEGGVRRVERWVDPGLGEGNRKLSMLSLVPGKHSHWGGISSNQGVMTDDVGSEESGAKDTTCIVNAAIMQNSWPGAKKFNKPVVVDMELPVVAMGRD